MNPTNAELAFAQSVAPGLQILRLCGADWRTVESDQPCLVASVENSEHSGGGLWKATVRVRLEFPAIYEGQQAAAAFSSATEALREWLSDPANISNIEIANGTLAGSYLLSAELLPPQDSRWVAEFAVLIGWHASS